MITEKPHRIAFGAALLLCALYGLVIAGVIGTQVPPMIHTNSLPMLPTNSLFPGLLFIEQTNLGIVLRYNWHLQTNWLVEPKDRLLLGPFPREQRYLEYGVVQSNLVAEVVYGGKTQHVTLESTPGMSITRSYKMTVELLVDRNPSPFRTNEFVTNGFDIEFTNHWHMVKELVESNKALLKRLRK